jgi:hypothetical protein
MAGSASERDANDDLQVLIDRLLVRLTAGEVLTADDRVALAELQRVIRSALLLDY